MKRPFVLFFLLSSLGAMACDVPCPVHPKEKLVNCARPGHLHHSGYEELLLQYDQGKICADRPGLVSKAKSSSNEKESVTEPAATKSPSSNGKKGLLGVASKVAGAIGGFVKNAFAKDDGNPGDHGAAKTTEGLRDETDKRGTGGAYQFCGKEEHNPGLDESGKLKKHRVYSMYVTADDGKFVASKKSGKATCESVMVDGNGEILGRVSLGAVFRDANNTMTAVPSKVKGSQLGLTGEPASFNYEAWPPIGDPKTNPISWSLSENGGCRCTQDAVYSFIQSDPEKPSQLAARKYKTDDKNQPVPVGVFADLNELIRESQEEAEAEAEEKKADGKEDFQFARLFKGQEDPQFYKSIEEFSRTHKVPLSDILDKKVIAKLHIPEALKNLFEAATQRRDGTEDQEVGAGTSEKRPVAETVTEDPVEKETPAQEETPARRGDEETSVDEAETETGPSTVTTSAQTPNRVIKPEVEAQIRRSRETAEALIQIADTPPEKEVSEMSDAEVQEAAKEAVEVGDNIIFEQLCNYGGPAGLLRRRPSLLLDLEVQLGNPNECRIVGKK